MKTLVQFFSLTIMLFCIALVFSGCKKDNPQPPHPYNGKSSAVFNAGKTYGTIIDVEGNEYKTITIGNLVWMAENLRTTKYRNGDPIINEPSTAWANYSTGAYSDFEGNTDAAFIASHGRLYNHFAVKDARGIAPAGWRVPTESDWKQLMSNLGGSGVAGAKLKETGILHWDSPNTNASNSSGFTALASGERTSGGTFNMLKRQTTWWASTNDPSLSTHAVAFYINYNNDNFYQLSYDKNYGYSIRCVTNK